MNCRCKPKIWCYVKKGTEHEFREQNRLVCEELNIDIQTIFFKDNSNQDKSIKKLIKRDDFSKSSDFIVLIYPAGEAGYFDISRQESVKIFLTVPKLHAWLKEKYNSTRSECLI